MLEKEFYNKIANWSFDDIKYVEENFTDWDYIEKINEIIKVDSKVLDLELQLVKKF